MPKKRFIIKKEEHMMNKGNAVQTTVLRKTERPSAPFQKIADACRSTGLSQHYLRKGCKDGSIPHIRSGTTYYINVPRLLRRLDAETATQFGGEAV